MYCPKCGLQNTEDAAMCASCGTAIGQTPVTPPTGLTEPQTCGLATTSLVLGILSIFCNIFTAIPAIICAIIALVKISKSQGRLKGNGFAIAGIAVPIVTLFLILPMLMAILMPALSKVKGMAEREVCAVNLKGLSIAMRVYANDYNDQLPTEHWCDFLIEEADVSPKSFICPGSDAIEGECCYALNKHVAGKKQTELSPNMVLFFETDLGFETGPRSSPISERRHYEFLFNNLNYQNESTRRIYNNRNTMVYRDCFNQVGGRDDVALRHDQHGQLGCNIAFADGHIEFVTEDRLDDLIWTIE